MTLTTAISVPAQIVNGDASMGQQLAQKWCSDCHAVGAEDAEAYGSMPSFVTLEPRSEAQETKEVLIYSGVLAELDRRA